MDLKSFTMSKNPNIITKFMSQSKFFCQDHYGDTPPPSSMEGLPHIEYLQTIMGGTSYWNLTDFRGGGTNIPLKFDMGGGQSFNLILAIILQNVPFENFRQSSFICSNYFLFVLVFLPLECWSEKLSSIKNRKLAFPEDFIVF